MRRVALTVALLLASACGRDSDPLDPLPTTARPATATAAHPSTNDTPEFALTLATGTRPDFEKTLSLVDIGTGTTRWSIPMSQASSNPQLSGQFAVVASGDAVRRFELDTGAEVEPLFESANQVNDLAFSPDGSRLAVVPFPTGEPSVDGGAVYVIDVESRQVETVFAWDDPRFQHGPTSYAGLPAGVRWLDADTLLVRYSTFNGPGAPINFLVDVDTGPVAGYVNGAYLIDSKGKFGVVEAGERPAGVLCAAWSGIQVVDLESGEPLLAYLPGPDAGVARFEFAPDERALSSRCVDGTPESPTAARTKEIRVGLPSI